MKKTLYPLLFCTFFITYNVSSAEKNTSISEHKIQASINQKSAAAPKKHKHKRRSLPNGAISLDMVVSDNVFHMLVGRHEQGKKSLWYQQSSDHGKSWTDAVKIIDREHIEANFNRGSDARLAVQGTNIIALWASRKEGAGRHNAGPMSAARSSDNGKSWQVGPIPADIEVGAHNFIAMDGNSSVISAVWLDRREVPSQNKRTKKGLRHAQSSDGGLTWTANKTLDDNTCACCWNTAKYSDSGELFVLYRDQEPSDMFMGVLDQAQQWTPLNQVGHFKWDFKGCPHIGGGIAFQSQSKLMHTVVGTGHPDHLGVFYLRSKDSGKNWSQPVQLGDESALHSDLAAAENGRIIAVWDMRSEDGLSIFYAESTDQGLTWTTEKRLSKTGYRATHPRIVSSDGKFMAVWTESLDGKKQSLQMQHL